MEINLTEKWLAKAEKPLKDYVVSDVRSQNLSVIVRRSGTKTFIWRGRLNGKTDTVTLGKFDVHSLADAREWADGLTAERDKGVDIKESKREAFAAKVAEEIDQSRTVRAAFEVYMKHHGDSLKDAYNKRQKFEREILPFVGDRLMSSITFDDLDRLVANKGKEYPGAANKLHAAISAMWNWIVSNPIGRLEIGLRENVYAITRRPFATNERERLISDIEICYILRALDAESETWRAVYKLAMFTGCRRSEIAKLRFREIVKRPEGWVIDLPGRRMKNDESQDIPLHAEAVREIDAAKTRNGKSQFLFPAGGDEDALNAVSGFSKTHARVVKRVHALAQAADSNAPLEHWTMHDFRRSIRTFFSENDVTFQVGEAILSHAQGKSKIQRIYDKSKMTPQKRAALYKWGDHLMKLDASSRAAATA